MNDLISQVQTLPPEIIESWGKAARAAMVGCSKNGKNRNPAQLLFSMYASITLYIALTMSGITEDRALAACSALGKSIPSSVQMSDALHSRKRRSSNKISTKLEQISEMLVHSILSSLGKVTPKIKESVNNTISTITRLFTQPSSAQGVLTSGGNVRRGYHGGAAISNFTDWLKPSFSSPEALSGGAFPMGLWVSDFSQYLNNAPAPLAQYAPPPSAFSSPNVPITGFLPSDASSYVNGTSTALDTYNAPPDAPLDTYNAPPVDDFTDDYPQLPYTFNYTNATDIRLDDPEPEAETGQTGQLRLRFGSSSKPSWKQNRRPIGENLGRPADNTEQQPTSRFATRDKDGTIRYWDTRAEALASNPYDIKDIRDDATDTKWRATDSSPWYHRLYMFGYNDPGAAVMAATGAVTLGIPAVAFIGKLLWRMTGHQLGRLFTWMGEPKQGEEAGFWKTVSSGVGKIFTGIEGIAEDVSNYMSKPEVQQQMEKLGSVASNLIQGIGTDLANYQTAKNSYDQRVSAARRKHNLQQQQEKARIRRDNAKYKEQLAKQIHDAQEQNRVAQEAANAEQKYNKELRDYNEQLAQDYKNYNKQLLEYRENVETAKIEEKIVETSGRYYNNLIEGITKLSISIVGVLSGTAELIVPAMTAFDAVAGTNRAAAASSESDQVAAKVNELINKAEDKKREAQNYMQASQRTHGLQSQRNYERARKALDESTKALDEAYKLADSTQKSWIESTAQAVKTLSTMANQALAAIETVKSTAKPFIEMPSTSAKLDFLQDLANTVSDRIQPLTPEERAKERAMPVKDYVKPAELFVPKAITGDDDERLEQFIPTPFINEEVAPSFAPVNTLSSFAKIKHDFDVIDAKYKKKEDTDTSLPYVNPMPSFNVSGMDGRPSTLRTTVTPTPRWTANTKPASIGIPQSALQRASYTAPPTRPSLIPTAYQTGSRHVSYRPLAKKKRRI